MSPVVRESPLTGWGRDHWAGVLATLTGAFVRAAERGGSPARPRLPGAPDGLVIEGLEAFARMSVAWGAWLGLHENGVRVGHADDSCDVLELVVRGLLDGTQSGGRFAWGAIEDRDQRIVEAAELATALWLGRSRLVPALGSDGLRQVLDWTAQVHGRDVYDDNWVLFPSTVATVARALGRRVADRRIDEGIDAMLARYAGDGWYADGPGHAFDQYSGWAVHWHLMLWARIDGDRRPRVARTVERRFRTYLRATVPLVAADGSRPLLGRSLGYRFAAAAPMALAALLRVDGLDAGLARRAASGMVRHDIEAGAIDPDTGWLRRGVAGERPDVCERYMSRGAVAWAAHALVALGVPASDPFWRARERRLPAERSTGVEALRGPGFLVGWRRATGETWVASALADHEPDIPGHDYAPFYGKHLYRSHFPLSVVTGGGGVGPDGAVLFDAGTGAVHRTLTGTGGAGPGWTWSSYRVGDGAGAHAAVTAVLPWGDVEVRVSGITPGSPVRVSEAPAALGVTRTEVVRRGIDDDGTSWATDGERLLAVRVLLGHHRALASAPGDPRGPDRNLVWDHAEQPIATEDAASAVPRVVATVGCAIAAPSVPREMARVRVLRPEAGDDRWMVRLRLGDSETALVAVGPSAPRGASIAGWAIAGDGLRVVRVARGGGGFAGESVRRIEGVATLARSGPVAIRRRRSGGRAWVDITTADGIEVDVAWAQSPLAVVDVRHGGAWRAAGRLASPGVVPPSLVRRLQREQGTTLIRIRLR